ncbi:hypothetical protein [Ruegeria sp.]|uniref:hypothetical protein n=1 Tax=Ruegeria sp. TaxID=1879320 RepID=UPI003C7C454B
MSNVIDRLWDKLRSLETSGADVQKDQVGWSARASDEAFVVHARELPENFKEAAVFFHSMGMMDAAAFLEECVKISTDEDEFRLHTSVSALLQYKYPLY